MLVGVAAIGAALVANAIAIGWHGPIGMDFDLYLGFTRGWLAGQGWYLPEQLAGPYVVEAVTGNTYPRVLLYLTVPFALGLPAVLWWLIPIGIVAWTLYRNPPAPWGWALLAFAFCYPRTWTLLAVGNPSMWAMAFIVAGSVWGWPAVGVALKVTLAPLAIVGIRHRSWWVATIGAGIAAIPFGTLWLDYGTSLTNATSERGFGYLAGEWPIALALLAVTASGLTSSPSTPRPR